LDRNKTLAVVLCLAVYTLWLFYQMGREPPADYRNAPQQYTDQADAGMTQDYDATGSPLRQERAESPVRLPSSPSQAELRPLPQVAAWEGEFTGQEFAARVTNDGAALTQWMLTGFWELDAAGKKGRQIELVNLDARNPRALEMPFEALGFGDLSTAAYEVVNESPNGVTFRLERGGIEILKRYAFDLDGYGFELSVEVHNGSEHLIAPDFGIRWPTTMRQGNDYTEQSLITLHGPELELERELVSGVGQPGFFDGIFGGSEEDEVWRDVSWAGVDLKYFVSVLLPEPIEGSRVDFEALEPGEAAAAVLKFSPVEIAPGETIGRQFTGFFGPKESQLLDSVGRDVTKSIDLGYSWFEPLTRFFQWLLEACYRFVPNYGLSIILITILVRFLTLPILNKQMRSMEKMRALQPRLKELQAEFSDDRQKQSEATMALYKETGVNPLGGCLPMLLQFPVFIGLFFALKSSFALRQAPFMLWINDLSAPDVLFVVPGLDFPLRLLPIVMGGSMVLQQKLTPTTVDPSQQKMMMIMMPVMMTVLFYQFPSGLVLYWMISNFLGIAHQMLVGRRMQREG
jgi:YidC/Oxa1 family membrane protein insertase